MQVIQQQRKQQAQNVQAPQVIRSDQKALPPQQLGNLKPSSIQSLMQNLKIHQQSSGGGSGGSTASGGSLLHHHSSSGSVPLNNSQNL